MAILFAVLSWLSAMAFLDFSILNSIYAVIPGAILSYFIVTVVESFIHEHVFHARKSFRGLQRRFPTLLGIFHETYRSHTVIHHAHTYTQDHVTQFCNAEHKTQVDSMLTDRHGRRIIREEYGRTIHLGSVLWFLVPLLPFIIPVAAFAPWSFSVGFAIPVTIYPLMSKVIHPYLHLPYADAINRAPWWLGAILSSAYMRCLWRHHWLHHRYPRHNFNLLLGGDFIRGVYRPASPSDLEAMKKIGIPVD